MIINGNALFLPLADESVHCVITSPPYYALRDYLTGQWIGGDEACKHLLGDTPNKRGVESSTLCGGIKTTAHQQEGYIDKCKRCGALRVDQPLGLEALPDCLGWASGNPCGECYVCNTVQWAREVWRVLRKDGTFWLNLGDSYSNAGTRQGDRDGNINKIANEHRKIGNGYRPRVKRLKNKDLVGIPWRVAFALQNDGWFLRQNIIWAKGVNGQDTIRENAYKAALREGLSEIAARRIADAVDPYVGNCMPESVTDRCTKSHEDVFLFSKSSQYFFDHVAILDEFAIGDYWIGRSQRKNDKDNLDRNDRGSFAVTGNLNGRNRRSVWTINTQGFEGEHYAAFPPKLVEPCVLSGTSEKGCCPKCGAQWVRVLQKTKKVAGSHKGSLFSNGKTGAREGGGRTQDGERYESRFVGWQPGCKCYKWETCIVCGNEQPSGRLDCGHNICDECLLQCEKEEHEAHCEMWPKPSTVLDPFSGTGTVGEVCAKLGRNYVGNELNPDYINLQKARVRAAMFKYTMQRKQTSLFDETVLEKHDEVIL